MGGLLAPLRRGVFLELSPRNFAFSLLYFNSLEFGGIKVRVILIQGIVKGGFSCNGEKKLSGRMEKTPAGIF